VTDPNDLAAKPDVVQLPELGRDLLNQAHDHHSRRAAKTLVSGPSMRATLIALALGAELAEHDAPPAATLQVISGQVRLHTDERQWRLAEGEVVAIPPARHGLEAATDAVVLLTVALR
jgi:quercetin dioxygenase-like cupin family protein